MCQKLALASVTFVQNTFGDWRFGPNSPSARFRRPLLSHRRPLKLTPILSPLTLHRWPIGSPPQKHSPLNGNSVAARGVFRCSRSSSANLLAVLYGAGIPSLLLSSPFWGPMHPSWEEVIASMCCRCSCLPGPSCGGLLDVPWPLFTPASGPQSLPMVSWTHRANLPCLSLHASL